MEDNTIYLDVPESIFVFVHQSNSMNLGLFSIPQDKTSNTSMVK